MAQSMTTEQQLVWECKQMENEDMGMPVSSGNMQFRTCSYSQNLSASYQGTPHHAKYTHKIIYKSRTKC